MTQLNEGTTKRNVVNVKYVSVPCLMRNHFYPFSDQFLRPNRPGKRSKRPKRSVVIVSNTRSPIIYEVAMGSALNLGKIAAIGISATKRWRLVTSVIW